MSKKVYISGNTANCFDDFTLCCTKDFENKFLTNNSSLVDNEEYFYADFKSVENIESCYENKIIKLQDQITKLEHRLSNCIEPKFVVGQKIYVIGTENVEEVEYFGENIDGIITFEEGCRCGCTPDRYSVEKRENVFATEAEAKAKLREIQDGN